MDHHGKLLLLLPLLALFPGCDVIGTNTKSAQDASTSDSRIEKEALFSARLRCADEGWRYDERTHKELAEAKYLLYEPHFFYNPKLNTCLYDSGFMVAKPYYETKYIVDLSTNENLAEYNVQSRPNERSADDKERISAFEKQELALMGRKF